jgi:hypothetical protein
LFKYNTIKSKKINYKPQSVLNFGIRLSYAASSTFDCLIRVKYFQGHVSNESGFDSGTGLGGDESIPAPAESRI